ncbi:hypothetical protein RJD11_10130 [Bacillus velezensis]|uniref:hypothetical protein n=1 Tax=Bacillus TaxID=1386 RepID=UPI001C530D48|nr:MULTISPECIES: hypothetical protein [Bacillus amyloliquefaciens group]QXP99022.1 hypothetical protein KVY05_10035 [Bacillus velezensis]UHH04852.1 hypothetical protein LUA14_10085 [Bacillus amyloliquefaciens]ULR24579.1 hypothetical protein MJE83_10085 [Bacillus velezensis]UVW11389.1 hypothetical protein NX856_10120 [Bacillus velezensis]WHL78726.1 hypothetical protein QLH34_10105 [Bacillus velezensis]
MSTQRGTNTPEELAKSIQKLGREMQEFNDCINGIREIVITLDEDDGSFTITTD